MNVKRSKSVILTDLSAANLYHGLQSIYLVKYVVGLANKLWQAYQPLQGLCLPC
jgi:hypothetical protein